MPRAIPVWAASVILLLPSHASALTAPQAIGFFNILAGFMLTAAFIAFLGGFIIYMVRLGTQKRDDGLFFMRWGVSILFVLVLLLGVVQFLEHHALVAQTIVAFILVGLVVWAFVAGGKAAKKAEKEE